MHRKVHCSPAYNSHNMEATIMLSKDELTRKMWDTYARECYKVIKKKENMPFAAMWMHPEILLLSEIREMEKAIYPMTPLVCISQKKNDTNANNHKTKTDSQTCKMNSWFPQGNNWGWGERQNP